MIFKILVAKGKRTEWRILRQTSAPILSRRSIDGWKVIQVQPINVWSDPSVYSKDQPDRSGFPKFTVMGVSQKTVNFQ